MAAKMLHRMFVYGTLKRGEPNHYLLSDSNNGVARLLGRANLVKKYPLVVAGSANIPYLLAAEGSGKVVSGEVYEVDDDMLKRLDQLEDHPHFYTRIVMDCVLEPNDSPSQTISCEVYLLYDFKQELLSLPYISSYENTTEKKYTPRNDRVELWINEIKAKYKHDVA